uniref:Uncharacterized protein n=1 Tax=Rhizophora mucronata TaxID=61149 RepID=A0A2P2NCX7_RHIMU
MIPCMSMKQPNTVNKPKRRLKLVLRPYIIALLSFFQNVNVEKKKKKE